MKMSSKQKWALVFLIFVVSVVGLFTFPTLGFQIGFPTAIASFIMMLVSGGYGLAGMIDAKVFERFYEWLKSDDV